MSTKASPPATNVETGEQPLASSSPTSVVMQFTPGSEPKAPTHRLASFWQFLNRLPRPYKTLLFLGVGLPAPTVVLVLILVIFQNNDSVSMLAWFLLATAPPLYLWTVVLPLIVVSSIFYLVKNPSLKASIFYIAVIILCILPYAVPDAHPGPATEGNILLRPVSTVLSMLYVGSQ
jgi:hypothetical protein